MSSAPAVFPFYGEGAGRLFTIYCDVTQACCNRPTHDPHVTHSTRVMGKRNWRGSYYGKTPPRSPAHRSGPGPITRRAYVWPRPRGSCRCTKVGALLLTPLLVHGQSEPRATAALGKAGEVNRGRTIETKQAKRRQGQDHREQMDEAGFPGKTLAGAASAAPARPLPGQLAHTGRASHP